MYDPKPYEKPDPDPKKIHSWSITLRMSLWPGERYSDDVAVWTLGKQGVHCQTMVL
jgi:hypothetical protein